MKIYFIAIFSTALSILLVPSLAFQFNDKGEFTIIQFTDFHYCENTTLDVNIQQTHRKILEIVKPDLAVISGDGLCPNQAFYFDLFKKHGVSEACWRKMTDPFVEAKVPYAYTLGNHDGDGDMTNLDLVRFDQTNPYSLKSKSSGIPDSPTFYIPIFSQQAKDRLAANVWILDTNRRDCNGTKETYGCIEENILDWYDRESADMKAKYGEDVHHLAFYHVPIPEYIQIFNREDSYGEIEEKVCCPTVNTGFFARAKKNGDITGMFVGHDHGNNFGGWLDGIELVYGQNSGHGSYGGVRGARVIKLKESYGEDGRLTVTREHYVIYEDGSIGSRAHNRITQRTSQPKCYSHYGDSNVSRLIDAGFFEGVRHLIEIGILIIVILIIKKFWGTSIKKSVVSLKQRFQGYNKMTNNKETLIDSDEGIETMSF